MVRSMSSTDESSILELIGLNDYIRYISMKMKSEVLQSVEVSIMCIREI